MAAKKTAPNPAPAKQAKNPAKKAVPAKKAAARKVAKPVPSAKPETVAEQDQDGLTKREALFVEQYLIDMNGTQAYMRVYQTKNPEAAGVMASKVLSKPRVKAAVTKAIAARVERLQITQDDVLRGYMNRLNADPRNLVEYRRTCCRHCYGEGHLYQRTPAEFKKAQKAHAAKFAEMPAIGEFDPEGGVGYDKRKPPHAECPECFGEGIGHVIIKDTRNFDQKTLSLYAGVEVGKDGIKVKINSQDAALDNLARHTGFFKEDNEQQVTVIVSNEELDEIYAKGVADSQARKAAFVGRGERVRANVRQK